MANEFFLLTWYEHEQMVLVEGFLGIGALSESTLEESRFGRKKACGAVFCGITRTQEQLTSEKTS